MKKAVTSIAIMSFVMSAVALADNNGKSLLAQYTAQQAAKTSAPAKSKKKNSKAAKKVSVHSAVKPVVKTVQRAAVKPAAKQVVKTVQQQKNLSASAVKANYASNAGFASASALSPATAETTLEKKPEAEESEDSGKPGTFNFKYRSNNGLMLNALENPTATQNNGNMDHEVQAWDRVNITYHITNNISVDLMPQFYHTWFGNQDRIQSTSTNAYQQPYAGYMGETGLGVIDSKLATLGPWTLDGYAGYFFPTAEWEQLAGTLGASRTSLGLGRSFGKLDVKWIESLWYYFEQTQVSSVPDNGSNYNPVTGGAMDPNKPFTPPLPLQNPQYDVWSLADFTWNFSKKFYFDLTSGFLNTGAYADTLNIPTRPAVLSDYIIIDPEIGYEFTKNFALCVGLWEQADMRNQTVAYYPFNGDTTNTQAYFMTTVKF